MSTSVLNKDNTTTDSFLVALALNGGNIFAVMLVFVFLRPWRCTPRLLNFRRYFSARIKGMKLANKRHPYHKVPEFKPVDKSQLGNHKWPWGMISWVPPVFFIWRYPDKRLFKTPGADAEMHLVYLRNIFILSLMMAGPAMVVLLPVEATATNKDLDSTDPNYTTGMAVITMSNIAPSSGRMAVVVTFMYFFSLLCYITVYWTYKNYSMIRKRWLNHNHPRAYTMVIDELPSDLQSDDALKDFFVRNCPVGLVSAHICYDTTLSRKYIDKWRGYVNSYEKALRSAGAPRPWWKCGCGPETQTDDPQTTTGCHGCCYGCACCGDKVSALPFFKAKIEKYEDRINKLQQDPSQQLSTTRVGFVTFDSPFPTRMQGYFKDTRILKLNTIKDLFLLTTMSRPSPDNTDVKWRNLTVIRFSCFVRTMLLIPLLLLSVVLWAAGTVGITGLANAQNLSNISAFSWLGPISDWNPFARAVIQGFIPTLILFVLVSIWYPLMKLILVRLQGQHTFSGTYRAILLIYWLFLIGNVFLLVTISGIVIKIVQEALDDPSDALDLLAWALPQQSLFFMMYMMVGASRLPIQLFRPGNLIKWFLCLTCCRGNNRFHRNNIMIPNGVDWAQLSAVSLLMFGLMLIYSVMAPLITAIGVIYFGTDYFCTRYNVLYAHVVRWDFGAKLWRTKFHIIMAIIMVWQIVMISLLSVNVNIGSIVALGVLPFITLFFWIVVDMLWKDTTEYGAYGHVGDESFQFRDSFGKAYIDPSLRSDYFLPYDWSGEGPRAGDGHDGDAMDEEMGSKKNKNNNKAKGKQLPGLDDTDDEEESSSDDSRRRRKLDGGDQEMEVMGN